MACAKNHLDNPYSTVVYITYIHTVHAIYLAEQGKSRRVGRAEFGKLMGKVRQGEQVK